ncbi:Qat anti-phage system TatD family nuclease QatD [Altererythrobacter sp. C41]|uniref:Qat anti-phage system TatD family nuclease QatD n=1 Tax=Altererythrobacter sp. C41 TaxID=2806021 RepID=UPI00193357D8|nr:Qat anti-phage system TatD family nuclease QatD [Altererythrobacter sp. C41]MBM0169529.1 TatD family hydrolase [Altererythrobacter sp. C41]
MIDFHCHLDLYPDPQEVLRGIDARGTYVLAVTTTPKAWRGTKKLVGERKRVRVALGLHPEVVGQRHQEVALLCGLMPESRYVGEIGLDGSLQHKSTLDLQQKVFTRILAESARLGGRIMTIHSRGAATAVLDALESEPRAGVPILHWFSGTKSELDRAIALGCWFSVGPAMMRSSKGRELASLMPLDRMLTETDAPFTKSGPAPLMPWQAYDCLSAVAAAREIAEHDLGGIIRRNLRRITQMNSPFELLHHDKPVLTPNY